MYKSPLASTTTPTGSASSAAVAGPVKSGAVDPHPAIVVMDDVRAFVQTSRRLGLPLAVERSRSGNGAHVWFFFATPVAAATARKMGCHLITETMASRHELGMDSYDRLFPSQDTMPRGGFGNLIALPLQHGPRQEGNSVFLNDDLVAFPDEQQWAHLASIKRIDALTVERIASDASRAGSVVGSSHGGSGRRRGRCTVDAAAIREGAITAHHRAPAESSVSGALAEALRREGRPALAAAQPDQAYCGLPESGVLQEAEHAAVDGAHPAGDLLRRRSPAACRATPRLQTRSRGAAPRSRCRSRCRRRARLR